MATVNNGPNAQEINQQIRGLDYVPEEILAFPGSSVTSFIPRTGELTPQKFVVVTKTKHTVSGSFDIAVPNARRDITYPGALLLANQKLVEGVPDPLVVPKTPRKITIDLPGLTDDNSLVPETMDYAGVSAGINKLIGHWLDTKSKQFTIAANTEFKRNILYNESEMALQFGVDVSYLKGKLGINFDSISKQETSAYLVMFRQIFYTVSVEQPVNPADIFDESVTWQDLAGKIDAKNPPAYVQNVQYGREVYVLLTSNMSSSELKTHLDGSLEFQKGTVTTSDDIKTKNLNKQITCTVITVGGKPVLINGNLNEDNILDQVNQLIQSNLELAGDNPAMPLVYTTTFLKNNAIAHIQGNTEYITTDSQEFTSSTLKLYHGGVYVAIFYVDWEEITFDQNGNTIVTQKHWSGSGVWRTVFFQTEIMLPANVRNIHVRILEETGLAWDNWWVVMDKILAPVGERDVSIYGWTLMPWYVMNPTDNMGNMSSFGPGFDDGSAMPQTPSQTYEANPKTMPLLGSPAGDPAMDANSFMPGTPQETAARASLDDYLKQNPMPGGTKYEDTGNDPYGELLPFNFDASGLLDDMITFDDILGTNQVRSAGPDASLVSLRQKLERIRKKAMDAAKQGGPASAQAQQAVEASEKQQAALPAAPSDVDMPLEPIVAGGVPLPGVPTASGQGAWYRFDQYFFYKLMKYQQSCFPCSIHTILANLGYMSTSDSAVEDLWNRLHGDLNASAPNEEQIHSYLAQTFELGSKGAIYTPMDFKTQADTDSIRAQIEQKFLHATGPVGLVAGVGHAEVFFRTKFGRFIHYRPSPEHDSITCEYILIRGLRTLEGDGEFALGIDYYAGAEETCQAAIFAMLIE